jgi:hypothetical protein
MLIDNQENRSLTSNYIIDQPLSGRVQAGPKLKPRHVEFISNSENCDQITIMTNQHKKLNEMRHSQMNYFDSRMLELQEKRLELDNRETSVANREEQLQNCAKRLELEKSELSQIRQLLRVENESLRVSSRDLRDQIRKYEVVIKMMIRSHPTKVPDA